VNKKTAEYSTACEKFLRNIPPSFISFLRRHGEGVYVKLPTHRRKVCTTLEENFKNHFKRLNHVNLSPDEFSRLKAVLSRVFV
jgi:hypothetical protein